ncbi:MAG: magnesium/cobalt transporter CorA [Myxococcales bacterium]|nr:magnesium/cobalt transporter CorA [Myxococcales bacterium]
MKNTPAKQTAMRRLLKNRKEKLGKAPGAAVHVGTASTEPIASEIHVFDGETCEVVTPTDLAAIKPAPSEAKVNWIHVFGVHEPQAIKELGQRFELHPLVIEDILNTDQRPKVEDYPDAFFVVARIFARDPKNQELSSEQLSIVLKRSTVLSFQERHNLQFDPIRQRLQQGKGKIRQRGADYITHSLLDVVVDSYFEILDDFGTRMENIETQLFAEPEPGLLPTIYTLRQELILLRKGIWPLREVLGRLMREESELIDEHTPIFFRDVYDHAIHVIDVIESYRDVLAGMVEIYLSSAEYRQNQVVKVLTIVATVFMPLTFIVGLYGMNFKAMPELEWRYGYPAVWIVLCLTAAGMVLFFRRKKWI